MCSINKPNPILIRFTDFKTRNRRHKNNSISSTILDLLNRWENFILLKKLICDYEYTPLELMAGVTVGKLAKRSPIKGTVSKTL